MIKLGKEQQQALDAIITFLKTSKELAFSLSGYAGTGKTFLIKSLIEYLEKEFVSYEICAPTHKAKTVLERFTNREGMTLHKLLALSPNLELFDLDFKYLEFLTNNGAILFPHNGVIVCDESSMINDELYDLLLNKCEGFGTKIIFIGDKAQLQPVNSFTHSKVFQTKDNFTLSKIYRQKEESGLSELLMQLRENPAKFFKESIGTEGSLICSDTPLDFFKKAIPYAKKAIKNSDILETKFLAYTNNRINSYNRKMKEILFGLDNQYDKFGMITCYDNLEFNMSRFWNSMDYIIVDEPEKTDISIPGFIRLQGYDLNLYDSSNKSTERVLVLDKEIEKDYLDSLVAYIEGIRLEAIEAKNRGYYRRAKEMWGQYYKVMKSFTTPMNLYYDGRLIRKKSFDYGYAVTVHKSQGSSINNVFIDMKNISMQKDRDQLRQLQYVAMSRAKQNAYILQ